MSRGEGTTEVIQNFLRVYRITPNPVSPNVTSLSELMFGRKIWTSLDSMHPQKRRDYKPKAKRIGRQFNNGLPVYLRNFRYWEPVRVAGVIVRKVGNEMYKIDL